MVNHRPAKAPKTQRPPFNTMLKNAAPKRSAMISPTVSKLNEDMVVKPPKIPTKRKTLMYGESSATKLEKNIIDISVLPMKFTTNVPHGKS